MQKGMLCSFAKGMAAGIIAGAAAATVCKCMVESNHKLSKGSGRAIKAVGDFIDGIHTMFK